MGIFSFTKAVFFQNKDLEIRKSLLHGNGVFSKKRIYKGSIIESAPIILGYQDDYASLHQTALHDYYFLLANTKTPFALGLGYASFYNHACPANAVYTINIFKESIQITAHRDIEIHEEITINYNGTPFDNSPVYFTHNPMM